jgi:hypothetical protein
MPNRGRLAIGSLLVTASMVGAQSGASAYDGGSAAGYANTWWNSDNSNYASFSDDCTNYVSQSLHDPSGGRFSYVGGSSTTDDYQWWMHYNSFLDNFTWSHSFTVAQDLYNFMMWHYPGGWCEGTAHTIQEQSAIYTPNSVVTGDLLFYDWQSEGHIDHAGIQVGIGTEPNSGWYGNFQDQHTTDRYHAFWSLLPYNSQWSTTTITFVHVDAANN